MASVESAKQDEGSICPVCLGEMVRQLCCAPDCGHVFHWACVDGKGIELCPVCQGAPFNPRRLYFELGCPNGESVKGVDPGYVVEKGGRYGDEQKFTVRYASGSIFEGRCPYSRSADTKELLPVNGYGDIKYPSGGSYSGQWMRGFPHGRGKMVYANGDVYEGEFGRGLREGTGVLRGKDGSYCSGEWTLGRLEGEGSWRTSDGTEVDGGKWKAGRISGDTHVCTPEGYSGRCTWRNGVLHGDFAIEDSSTGTTVVGNTEEGYITGATFLWERGKSRNTPNMMRRPVHKGLLDLHSLGKLFEDAGDPLPTEGVDRRAGKACTALWWTSWLAVLAAVVGIWGLIIAVILGW
eukprot:GHVU01047737.1.p1 GENE.GHVU01047737.1~~GHVU01047737.1.p1  ORF type:complete len:350 (+),score=18.62 GHVU01047737.1:325-1374(+)